MMDNDALYALRWVTAGDSFRCAEGQLRHQLVMTEYLKDIILETQKIHNQITEVADADKPWADDNRHRVKGLLVVGNAGCGKTLAADTAIKLLSPVVVPDGQLDPRVLTVRTPSAGTAASLAREIIVRSGLPISREPKDDDAARKVVTAAVRKKPTLLLIDELSRCTSPDLHAPRALLKESGLVWTMAISLLDETAWPTPLLMTGLPSLIDSLFVSDKDEGTRRIRGEARRRFNTIRIPDATIEADGPALEAHIDEYCRQLGIASTLKPVDEIGPRLVHASGYAFGTALVIAQKAVALAATRDGAKGKLKRNDFVAIYHFMAGGSMEANIFASSAWSQIDPAIVLPESFDDAKLKAVARDY